MLNTVLLKLIFQDNWYVKHCSPQADLRGTVFNIPIILKYQLEGNGV
jgi:hypothetical protein